MQQMPIKYLTIGYLAKLNSYENIRLLSPTPFWAYERKPSTSLVRTHPFPPPCHRYGEVEYNATLVFNTFITKPMLLAHGKLKQQRRIQPNPSHPIRTKPDPIRSLKPIVGNIFYIWNVTSRKLLADENGNANRKKRQKLLQSNVTSIFG